jgi:hypothetical protein
MKTSLGDHRSGVFIPFSDENGGISWYSHRFSLFFSRRLPGLRASSHGEYYLMATRMDSNRRAKR